MLRFHSQARTAAAAGRIAHRRRRCILQEPWLLLLQVVAAVCYAALFVSVGMCPQTALQLALPPHRRSAWSEQGRHNQCTGGKRWSHLRRIWPAPQRRGAHRERRRGHAQTRKLSVRSMTRQRGGGERGAGRGEERRGEERRQPQRQRPLQGRNANREPQLQRARRSDSGGTGRRGERERGRRRPTGWSGAGTERLSISVRSERMHYFPCVGGCGDGP